MKILFVRTVGGTGFSFNRGAEVDLPADQAQAFIRAGHAEAVRGGGRAETATAPTRRERATRK